MSLLTICQQVCRRMSLAAPTAVASSTQLLIMQIMALANEEGEDLAARYTWTALQSQSTFVTVAAQLQGAMATLAGTGFKYVINDTIWDRSSRRPIFGPLAPRDWQTLQATPVSGPFLQFRIRAGNLYIDPTPSAGNTCAFEWMSANWCQSSGGTGQSAWAADTDVGVLDEGIMTAGIIWRFKAAKGLDYAEDHAGYERRVTDAMARDGSKAVLDLAGGITDFRPWIFVPSGNWPL